MKNEIDDFLKLLEEDGQAELKITLLEVFSKLSPSERSHVLRLSLFSLAQIYHKLLEVMAHSNGISLEIYHYYKQTVKWIQILLTLPEFQGYPFDFQPESELLSQAEELQVVWDCGVEQRALNFLDQAQSFFVELGGINRQSENIEKAKFLLDGVFQPIINSIQKHNRITEQQINPVVSELAKSGNNKDSDSEGESEKMKTPSAYKTLCQEDKKLLQETAKKVAILLDKPKNLEYFRKQLTEFADKWTIYETATEAEGNGKWQASMGIPSNPLWSIWPQNAGPNCFPNFGNVRPELGAYTLLAIIHDNVLPNCPSIATEVLPKPLINEIWSALVTGAHLEHEGIPTGDNYSPRRVIPKNILKIFLEIVEVDIENYFAPPNSPRKIHPHLRFVYPENPAKSQNNEKTKPLENKHDELIRLSEKLLEGAHYFTGVATELDYGLACIAVQPIIKEIEKYLLAHPEIPCSAEIIELFSPNKPYREFPESLKRAAFLLRRVAENVDPIGDTGQAETAETTDIEINLKNGKFKKCGSTTLLEELILTPSGVVIDETRHGKGQPEDLKANLRRNNHGKAAESITKQKSIIKLKPGIRFVST